MLRLYAYPNPFNSTVRLGYELPVLEGNVRLSVYDMKGHRVCELEAGEPERPKATVVWNAEGLPSGVYLIRLEAGSFAVTRKVVLAR